MIFKGKISAGVMRGAPMVRIYFDRLVGILGFKPYSGTLNIELEKPVDIVKYHTKTISHILMDGSKKVECYLAPVTLIIGSERYDAWAVRQLKNIHRDSVVEIISRDNIKEKFSLKDNDEVKLEFFGRNEEKNSVAKSIFGKLAGSDRQLMKS